jgi:hypothetical protein
VTVSWTISVSVLVRVMVGGVMLPKLDAHKDSDEVKTHAGPFLVMVFVAFWVTGIGSRVLVTVLVG